MKIYTYRQSSQTRGSGRETMPVAPSTGWARFGRDTLFWSEEEQAVDAFPGASRGTLLTRREEAVTRQQLHVVVQNGRLFQQHHPDVPVLHDRGRFLLVKIDPERARALHADGETCYGVTPVADARVVFDERDAPAARVPVPFIQALASTLSRAPLEATLTKLVSFGTRHSTRPEFKSAATWARQRLADMGYRIRAQQVAVGSHNSRNIIADKRGTASGTRKVVIVTAHLDSINLQGGPTAPAPGADDNGSGSAGVLEMAGVFQGRQSARDLRFILFGGEEQGLFGSKHYVHSLSSTERARIAAVVNMDMVGSLNSGSRSVLLEGAAVSATVIEGLREAATAYTQLLVESSLNPFASDHVPFIRAGIPAVLTIEGADNTNGNVHSGTDVLETIDYDLLLEILRMNVAFVATVADTSP